MKTTPFNLASPAMAALTFLLLPALPGPVQAQSWVTNRSGDYPAATNWQGGVPPATNGNVVFQNPDLAVTSTVTFTANTTNGNVFFNRGVFVLDMGANTWELTSVGSFRVGQLNTLGASTDVTIKGGVVNKTNDVFFLGTFANDRENVLRLTNGATFNSQQNSAATVGRQGSSNQLIVSDGSIFSAAGLTMGSLAGANSNKVTVEGAGSELRLRAGLVLNGDNGTTNNALVISNGGVVYVTNAAAASSRIRLGAAVTTVNDGASILVTGSGSRLETTGDLVDLFMATTGGVGNRITVADGGHIQATNASLGLSTGALGFTQNKLVMNGGTANFKRVTLQNNSLDMLAGELNFSEDFFAGATWVLNFNGGTISAGSANISTQSMTVGDGNSSVAASYVLTGSGNHGMGLLLTVASDGSVRGNGVISRFNTGLSDTAVLNNGIISAGAGQTLRVVGTLTNQSGATLSVTNGGAFIISALATNAGAVNIGSGSSATFSNGLSGVGTVTNNGTLAIGASGGSSTISGVISGAGTLNKLGTGTLVLSGSNSFSGAVQVNGGGLNLNSTSGGAAGSVTNITVASGATLLISQSGQVANGAAVTLSGGTIAKAGGVINETAGALSLSSTSFLDFGTGTGNFTFASYTPGSFQLSLQNFNVGNSLTITTGLFTASQFNFNSFAYTFDTVPSGGFTITAIPEPSTWLAAAGLVGLMLWSVRQRRRRQATAD